MERMETKDKRKLRFGWQPRGGKNIGNCFRKFSSCARFSTSRSGKYLLERDVENRAGRSENFLKQLPSFFPPLGLQQIAIFTVVFRLHSFPFFVMRSGAAGPREGTESLTKNRFRFANLLQPRCGRRA